MTMHSGLHAEDFRSGHELSLDHRKLGMWLFLASEVMFFGGLIGTFLHYKATLPTPEAAASILSWSGPTRSSCSLQA